MYNINSIWGAVLLFIQHFLISRNNTHFLISRNRILDIKKSLISLSRNHFLISKNVFWGAVLLFIKYFLISRIWFLDIKNSFLDIKNLISWYQEFISNSWYQEMKFISWYQEIGILDIKKSKKSISLYKETHFEFLISKNISLYKKIFLDIKNISWYQRIHFFISRIHFLISRNRILDIKKCWINSKAAPHICVPFEKVSLTNFQFRGHCKLAHDYIVVS